MPYIDFFLNILKMNLPTYDWFWPDWSNMKSHQLALILNVTPIYKLSNNHKHPLWDVRRFKNRSEQQNEHMEQHSSYCRQHWLFHANLFVKWNFISYIQPWKFRQNSCHFVVKSLLCELYFSWVKSTNTSNLIMPVYNSRRFSLQLWKDNVDDFLKYTRKQIINFSRVFNISLWLPKLSKFTIRDDKISVCWAKQR